MRSICILFFCLLSAQQLMAQHLFEGSVDKKKWKGDVYLSLVEDYRKIEGIYEEQIISKVRTDSAGYFKIEGNQLENEHRIYKLHINKCSSQVDLNKTLSNDCLLTREIVFIAKNGDSIQFPISLDKEVFCDIQSTNSITSSLFEINSLKEEMTYAYSEYPSAANRKLNNKKWFGYLQSYASELNEPLAELYVFSYLSDRAKQFHSYYLKDIQNNAYYNELLHRLEERYPTTNYFSQYKSELASDRFMINENDEGFQSNWILILGLLLVASLVLNVYFIVFRQKPKEVNQLISLEDLTNQERKVLNHLLENKSNKEIAAELFVSVSTIKSHVNNIFKKYQVKSRDELKTLFN